VSVFGKGETMKAKRAMGSSLAVGFFVCSTLLGVVGSHANGAGVYGVAIHEWIPGEDYWPGQSPGDPLGPPDFDVVNDAFGIGRGGTLTLEMAVPFLDGPGADLTVYEYGSGAGGTNDPFEVWVSADASQYFFVGATPGDATDFELGSIGSVGPFRYVMIIDRDSSDQFDGADIDAVQAYTPENGTGPIPPVVPVPTASLLGGAGLGALGLIGWWKRRRPQEAVA